MLPSHIETLSASGVMDEEEVAQTFSFPEDESLYPMYFGVSCAFFVLRLSTVSNVTDEVWSEVREKMLQGTAQLLALLLWRLQERVACRRESEFLRKLEKTEREVEELKRIRREDAKANEKVVAIFAVQEQAWLTEKKKLQQKVGYLMYELRVAEKNKCEAVTELNGKLKEMELLMMSKDKILEEESQKRKEVEEKLSNAEGVAEELRVNAIRQAQAHSSELWKHKSAFLELVSNHRQLEAKLSRMLRHIEATKEELESISEQKEDAVLLVQNLSVKILKMRKETEQKDRLLLAMRKSQMDTAGKQILLKEVKPWKGQRKQTDIEKGGWRVVSESRHEKTRSKSADLVVDYGLTEFIQEADDPSLLTGQFSQEGNENQGRLVDIQWFEDLVLSEAEKYTTMLQGRHHQEIDALTEQIRLKDEKIDAFCWQLLSNDIELRQLQSDFEVLNEEVQQLRHEKMRLEALLVKIEEEITSLKKKNASREKSQDYQKTNFSSPPCNLAVADKNSWSRLETRKTNPGRKERKTRTTSMEVPIEEYIEKEGTLSTNQVKDFGRSPEMKFVHSPEMEFVHSPEMKFEDGEMSYQKGNVSPIQQSSKTNNSAWRMDLQALGVSYKIKRLRKQVLMLERLMGKKESGWDAAGGNHNEQDFLVLMSLLNKQVCRYLSLQGKTDDLCQRMHEKGGDINEGNPNMGWKKGKSKALEDFLEETFQLQKFMVASGQKLMELQSKISSILVRAVEFRYSAGFDVKPFVENVRSLFQEVQRGLEVRIARIIGDVEGTLACEGMRLKEV